MKSWMFLAVAIVAEVVATSGLKASNGFTRPWPGALAVGGYIVAFYCLSLTLRTMPVGIAYAIWAGLGVVLISLISWILYGQKLDLAAVIGMTLIVAGVVVLNVFSTSVAH